MYKAKNRKNRGRNFFAMCFMVNIQDAINFDIGFINSEEIKNSWIPQNLDLITSTYTYSVIDRDTLTESEPIESYAYRSRLRGIISTRSPGIVIRTKRESIQEKRAKRVLIDINKDTGGIFLCHVHGVDKHNRILIDLYHPVTGESMCDKILEKYADIYKKF